MRVSIKNKVNEIAAAQSSTATTTAAQQQKPAAQQKPAPKTLNDADKAIVSAMEFVAKMSNRFVIDYRDHKTTVLTPNVSADDAKAYNQTRFCINRSAKTLGMTWNENHYEISSSAWTRAVVLSGKQGIEFHFAKEITNVSADPATVPAASAAGSKPKPKTKPTNAANSKEPVITVADAKAKLAALLTEKLHYDATWAGKVAEAVYAC